MVLTSGHLDLWLYHLKIGTPLTRSLGNVYAIFLRFLVLQLRARTWPTNGQTDRWMDKTRNAAYREAASKCQCVYREFRTSSAAKFCRVALQQFTNRRQIYQTLYVSEIDDCDLFAVSKIIAQDGLFNLYQLYNTHTGWFRKTTKFHNVIKFIKYWAFLKEFGKWLVFDAVMSKA